MPKWNGRFREWNERQPSILPYQFHTRFAEKHVRMSSSDKLNCRKSIPLQYLRVFFVDNTLHVYFAQTVHALHHRGKVG